MYLFKVVRDETMDRVIFLMCVTKEIGGAFKQCVCQLQTNAEFKFE